MTTLQTALAVATTATTSGTLAAGKHTPVDATSGALTMTLPTPATVGARLRVEKVDASTNVVTVSGTIRGGASTISLAWQYEAVELFAETLTSWRVAAGHKTKASLDAAFEPLGDLTGFGYLPKWQRAKARVRSGTADAKILCVGDSTTAGAGSDGTYAPGKPGSYPYQLAALINAAGIPAARGLGVPTGQTTNDDTRWTWGTGWARSTSNLGWAMTADLAWSGATVGNLVFADAGTNADRFDVYYLTGSGLGSFTATATGGTGSVVATSGTPGVAKVTVSAAAAATTNTLTVTPAGGSAVHIIGVEPWLSTARRLRVGNAGISGTKAVTQWAADGAGADWNSQSCIKAHAPDLTIISLGINDANDGQPTSAYLAAIDLLVTAAQVSGDVVIMVPVPPDPGAIAAIVANVPLYTAGLRTHGLPLADLSKRWRTSGTALGYMFDTVHPGAVGYADIAQLLSRGLLAS